MSMPWLCSLLVASLLASATPAHATDYRFPIVGRLPEVIESLLIESKIHDRRWTPRYDCEDFSADTEAYLSRELKARGLNRWAVKFVNLVWIRRTITYPDSVTLTHLGGLSWPARTPLYEPDPLSHAINVLVDKSNNSYAFFDPQDDPPMQLDLDLNRDGRLDTWDGTKLTSPTGTYGPGVGPNEKNLRIIVFPSRGSARQRGFADPMDHRQR